MTLRDSMADPAHTQLVQARMWAQGPSSSTVRCRHSRSGLTVGTLVSAAILTGAAGSDTHRIEQVDHSWEDILGDFKLLPRSRSTDTLEREGLLKHEDRLEVKSMVQDELAKRKAAHDEERRAAGEKRIEG